MIEAFIEAHGGAETVAEKLGGRVNTVRVWRSRGFIPRAKWPRLMRAFPDVTLTELEQIEAAQDADIAA
jgi:hypothetical protein